jgi:drug/metabolite transporter (DMT)-like permease
VLGGFFALMAAATFAWTNAVVRRGVVSGSVTQAITLSIPPGVPIFLSVLLLTGNPDMLGELSPLSVMVFAGVGVSHFCLGRYCNYSAINAIGNNLAGPVLQFNLIVSLSLAVFFLGEKLTPLRVLGIILIVAGPAMIRRGKKTAPAAPIHFTPRLAEGYVFAFIAALCYGASPALVRFASEGKGIAAGLAGGVIASTSASIVMLLLLLIPGHWRELRAVTPQNAKWFAFSGALVYVSQIFAYMAVAIAPVTVTAPIIGLANIFRLYFAKLLTPDHEVFGRDVYLATAISFLGVVIITASVDVLPLPESVKSFLNWRWP